MKTNKEVSPMREIKSKLVKTYAEGEYIVEVYETGDAWEAWLFNKHYGVKAMMFGFSRVQTVPPYSVDLDSFRGIIESNLAQYIELYKAKYEDE